VTTTLILCGGRGARLRPLTDRIPKPLVPLNGKPCLQHLVDFYLRKGHRRFVFCIGYRGEMIVDFFRRHPIEGEIEFSDAGERASMLERLWRARGSIAERAFVAYGDTLIDVDLDRMAAEHEAHRAAITLTTAEVRSPWGLLQTSRAGRVASFAEKPVQTYFIGHMLLERAVLDRVPPSLRALPDGGGLVVLLERLVRRRRLWSFPYRGPQITFNSAQDLDQAERDLVAFFTLEEKAPR
jgi:glucose-1-phosphate cytidylyltransferase